MHISTLVVYMLRLVEYNVLCLEYNMNTSYERSMHTKRVLYK